MARTSTPLRAGERCYRVKLLIPQIGEPEFPPRSDRLVLRATRMASELGAYVLKIDAPLESRELKEIVSAFRPSSSVEGRRSMIG